LNGLFDRIVPIPRVRHGFKQTLDTLISEEAQLLATSIDNKTMQWVPRLPQL